MHELYCTTMLHLQFIDKTMVEVQTGKLYIILVFSKEE